MTALRRLPAAAAAGMLALVTLAPPASAAPPMVEWMRPGEIGEVLVEQGLITGTITGEENQTIDNLQFRLTPEVPADDPCSVDVSEETVVLDRNRTEDFEIDLTFPCNRAYEISVVIGYREEVVGIGGVAVPSDEETTASIPFSVAIPPAKVARFEATFDEGSREVRLTWARNSEPDLLGYFVERNPPGAEGFSRIGPELLGPGETSFTDPGIEDEHRYRVTAVRRGPANRRDRIQGEPSRSLTAGPERTEPTLPDVIPPPDSSPPPTSSPTSGGGGGGTRRAAPAPSRTRTTSNIFQETLPFDPSRTTLPPPTTEPPEDAAVLAEFDDETPDDRRATLVPIAGGLALVVGAMHLFLLSKRAGEPEDIPMSPR
jgi:hypothetical protein